MDVYVHSIWVDPSQVLYVRIYSCVLLYLQEARVRTEIENLERDTGFRLRVLAQNYPETPGETFTIATCSRVSEMQVQ